MLRLAPYGNFAAFNGAEEKITVRSKKGRALLAFLALPTGIKRSREEIIALLWSNREELQGRASLRQEISRLKRDLKHSSVALIVTSDTLMLDPAQTKVEPAQLGEELLSGLNVRDEAFDEWLRDMRLALEDLDNSPNQYKLASKAERRSIAILPFANLSDDKEQVYFADGVTQDITTELSRFHSLFVIASNSSFHYREGSKDVRQIGRELGVTYVVEGSVRKAGNRIRVTAQLLETSGGKHIWAERYDRELTEVFELQDELVTEIVTVIPDQLNATATLAARLKPANNLTAYDHYLRARWHLDRDFSSPEGHKHLLKATEIDPTYSRALVTLAGFLTYNSFLEGNRPDETTKEVLRLISCALESDPTDAASYAVAAEAIVEIDPSMSLKYAETALQLNPNNLTVINYSSAVLSHHGYHDRAVELLEKGIRHDPLRGDSYRHADLHIYYAAGRYKEAIALQKGWSKPPVMVYAEVAAAYAQLGMIAQAAEAAK